MRPKHLLLGALLSIIILCTGIASVQARDKNLCATVSSGEPGWQKLGENDFIPVNGDKDTWTWKGELLLCSGRPIGVMRTQKSYTNFELMLEWRHLKSAGNSGVFVWVSSEALAELKADVLPSQGIEVQILDHGYSEQYAKRTGKKGDWFTTNGDVFAVGKSKMQPFSPTSPNGSRSFPRKQLSKGAGSWNRYYVRCINGEVRLWVNGEEVSGGAGCQPATGYWCLESEGSPIEFRNIFVRELP
jgi:hypothetical protein